MSTYAVTLTPPPVTFPKRTDLMALYEGTTTLMVEAVSPQQACGRAQVMLPWRQYPRSFWAEAKLVTEVKP